jgi:hypothetical protein
MITRLLIFNEGEQCEARETRDFANVTALVEWLARVRDYGLRVRVIC